jgi:hypothetical protein
MALVALVVSGCSSQKASVTGSSSSGSASATSASGVSGGVKALVGTWTSLQTFVPVGCPIGDDDSTGTTSPCPTPRDGFDTVSVLAVRSDGQATLTFPGLDQVPATTCVGRLQVTASGVGVDQLTCHGPGLVATASYATPVAANLAGGCLSFSSDLKFEGHPGACSSTPTQPTITFGTVTAAQN